jgi:hypothetical protein
MESKIEFKAEPFEPYLSENLNMGYHSGNILQLNDPMLINKLINKRLFFYEECYNDHNYGLLYLIQSKFNNKELGPTIKAFKDKLQSNKKFMDCLKDDEKDLLSGNLKAEPFNFLPKKNWEDTLVVKYGLFTLKRELANAELTSDSILTDFVPNKDINKTVMGKLKKNLSNLSDRAPTLTEIVIEMIPASNGERPKIRMYNFKLKHDVAQEALLKEASLNWRDYFIKYANSNSMDNRAFLYMYTQIFSEEATKIEKTLTNSNKSLDLDYSKCIKLPDVEAAQ